MNTPAQPEPHTAVRPLWLCRRCGLPWPCGTARLALRAEFEGNHTALCIYLCGLTHEAVDDLYQLNPHQPPNPASLYARFLGWTSRRRRAGS